MLTNILNKILAFIWYIIDWVFENNNYVLPLPEECTSVDVDRAINIAYRQIKKPSTTKWISMLIEHRNADTLGPVEYEYIRTLYRQGHYKVIRMIFDRTPEELKKYNDWLDMQPIIL